MDGRFSRHRGRLAAASRQADPGKAAVGRRGAVYRAQLSDDTIWATVRNRDELIYIDNDFEVFLAPQDSSHRYYELEMNAANAVWDLLMEKPQRDCVRRIIGWDIHGLESAVKIDGRLNDPAAQNTGMVAGNQGPWFSLRECGKDECYPTRFAPEPGEIWRMNFSRVEWDVDVRDDRYVKRADKATGEPLRSITGSGRPPE